MAPTPANHTPSSVRATPRPLEGHTRYILSQPGPAKCTWICMPAPTLTSPPPLQGGHQGQAPPFLLPRTMQNKLPPSERPCLISTAFLPLWEAPPFPPAGPPSGPQAPSWASCPHYQEYLQLKASGQPPSKAHPLSPSTSDFSQTTATLFHTPWTPPPWLCLPFPLISSL